MNAQTYLASNKSKTSIDIFEKVEKDHEFGKDGYRVYLISEHDHRKHLMLNLQDK